MAVTRLEIRTPRTWTSTGLWWLFWTMNTRIGKYILPRNPSPPHTGPQEWKLPAKSLISGCEASYWESHGWKNVVLKPTRSITKRVVVWLHGGAFVFPVGDVHWKTCAVLAKDLHAEVVLVPYPLAPGNTASTVMPALMEVYKDLLQRAAGQEIVLAGDSCGGGIALSLAYLLSEHSIPLPSTLLLSSPWLDLSTSHPSIPNIQPFDPMIRPLGAQVAAQAWLTGSSSKTLHIPLNDLRDPSISPIFKDITPLAKSGIRLIVVGAAWDIMYPDSEGIVEQAEKAGIDTTIIVGRYQFHDFLVFGTDEAKEGLQLVSAAITKDL